MRSLLWVLLAASVLTAGCLGSVDPAKIDDQTLQEKGWSETDQTEDSVAMGLAQIATREYRDGSNPTEGTGVTVATTNDVPILDERRFIPRALEQVEEERGIEFTEAGTTTLTLPQLDSQAEANVYEFQKGNADGKAVLITPDECDSFVISVGYGITGAGGLTASEETYQDARDMARNVVC